MYVIGDRTVRANTAVIANLYIFSVPKINMPVYSRNLFATRFKYALT